MFRGKMVRSRQTPPAKFFHIYGSKRICVEVLSDVKLRTAGCHFSSEAEWTRIAGVMPMSRLIAIWNGLPDVAPVQRFTSRAIAVRRIWKAIQTIEPKRNGRRRPFGLRSKSNEVPLASRNERHESRIAQVIALLEAEGGVSLNQLASAMGWQKHSVRGYLSGTIRKKMGLKVVCFNNEYGSRAYRIVPNE